MFINLSLFSVEECFYNHNIYIFVFDDTGRANEGFTAAKELLVDKVLQLYQQNKYQKKTGK